MRRGFPATLKILLWLALAIIVSLPNAPMSNSELGRDQGVFLYIGKAILSGSVPYRDVWDHKPPLIYFINALGLLAAKGSRWGVWFIEVLTLYLSALISFAVMKRAFGDKLAYLGTVGWMLTLPLVLRGGNLPEGFGVVLQFATLLLFQKAEAQANSAWHYVALGVVIAASFLLKQTLIGIGASVWLFVWLSSISNRNWQAALGPTLSIISGGAIVLLTAGLYFLRHSALEALWDCMFFYNLVYIHIPTTQMQIAVLLKALELFVPSGVFFWSIAGWMAGLYAVWRFGKEKEATPPVLKIALLDLPIEVVLTSLTASGLYAHYYIPWLPSLGILSVFFPFFLARHGHAYSADKAFPIRTRALPVALTWLLAGLIGFRLIQVSQQAYRVLQAPREDDPVVEYIARMTSQDEFVLMWGAKVAYNFLADRPSPSRYAYQYPLYQKGYQSAERIREFLRELISNKPRLIIDTSTSSRSIPPIDPERRANWIPPAPRDFALLPEMDEVFVYLSTHYKRIGSVGPNRWDVYVYMSDE